MKRKGHRTNLWNQSENVAHPEDESPFEHVKDVSFLEEGSAPDRRHDEADIFGPVVVAAARQRLRVGAVSRVFAHLQTLG